jgi:hypothetical protein
MQKVKQPRLSAELLYPAELLRGTPTAREITKTPTIQLCKKFAISTKQLAGLSLVDIGI